MITLREQKADEIWESLSEENKIDVLVKGGWVNLEDMNEEPTASIDFTETDKIDN